MRTLKKLARLASICLVAATMTPVESAKSQPVAPLWETVVQTGPVCGGDEVSWLACAIYFEARNQSLPGQVAVAQSILNRVKNSDWPNTVEGVVRQGEERKHRCQYSFMCDGKPEQINDESAWALALFIADKVMGGHRQAGVTCAHSYRADYVTNKAALRWFATLQTDAKIGSHIFYCSRSA